VSILLLSGPVAIASTVCNSWTPVGSQFNVTESNQNKVKRIGCSTALDFYRKAFGPYSVPLPEMPLMVYGEDGSFTIRVPHDHDEDDGSIMFTTPISESSRVQLTEATPRAIVKDISDNVQALTDSQPSTWSPQAAILLSCTSRLWILGQRTKEEIETATRLLPQGLPLIGFYTFGELATAPEPQLHNCTLVVLLLGEQDNTASPLPVTHHPGEQIDDSKALLRRKFKRSEEGRARLEQQKEFFTNVMRQTNADLESANKKIHDQHQILKESITLAQGVQRRLLPKEQPEIEGYDIAGFSIYCDETGGDYIDYLPDGNGLGVVIGDVSGHGVASALLMASTRAFLRMRVSMGGTPAQYLTDINQMIAKDVLETGRFVTMQYLHLDPDTRQVTWARAGHEPALHYSPEDNRFTEFRGEGLTLGVLEDSTYEDHTTPAMKPGEIIILSTDGITEVQDHQGRLFGRNRLQDIIQKNGTKSAQEILQLCKDELQAFRGDENRADDETLVIIKVS
jgi:serine phosphatase RsbU (regulator of sigma subunit)